MKNLQNKLRLVKAEWHHKASDIERNPIPVTVDYYVFQGIVYEGDEGDSLNVFFGGLCVGDAIITSILYARPGSSVLYNSLYDEISMLMDEYADNFHSPKKSFPVDDITEVSEKSIGFTHHCNDLSVEVLIYYTEYLIAGIHEEDISIKELQKVVVAGVERNPANKSDALLIGYCRDFLQYGKWHHKAAMEHFDAIAISKNK